jgi:hypothetical protein
MCFKRQYKPNVTWEKAHTLKNPRTRNYISDKYHHPSSAKPPGPTPRWERVEDQRAATQGCESTERHGRRTGSAKGKRAR